MTASAFFARTASRMASLSWARSASTALVLIPSIRPSALGASPGLACRQIEAQRVAKRVAGSMDLAGKAATRAAKSLISPFFFAPAAQA